MFIRSILESSAAVWHSSLSIRNSNDLERIQKSAVRIILNDRNLEYDQALSRLSLDTLEKRREKLCLAFAKNCLKIEKAKMFFQKSFFQNLLNIEDLEKRNFLRFRGV